MNDQKRRWFQCLCFAGVVGTLAACQPVTPPGNTAAAAWNGGCFTVQTTNPPAPHTKADDRFCVLRAGNTWFLLPRVGLEVWKAIDGDVVIPLASPTINPTNMIWDFDLDVTNHVPQNPSGSNHGRVHQGPNFGYQLFVKTSAPVTADITVRRPAGDVVHGGTAHATQD